MYFEINNTRKWKLLGVDDGREKESQENIRKMEIGQ